MRISRFPAVLALVLPLVGHAQGISQDIKPLPAELMPLAAGQSLVLDVTDTGKRLVAVGERGHVIGSLDGENWVQVPTPTRATLTAVAFADENNGWAVGHDAVILRTRDGGRSWILQNFEPELERPFLDVLLFDAQHGLAVGAYGLMYVTFNGGDTWEGVETPIREDEFHFNALTQLNNGYLFIAGEAGVLALSRDKGVTWEAIESPYESSMFDAAPVGESGVVIVGLRGNVYMTADIDDPDWQQVDLGTNNSLIGASALPDGEVAMVGVNGVIFRSRDGLSSSQRLANPVGITLAAVQPVDGALVVVGDAGAQLIKNP